MKALMKLTKKERSSFFSFSFFSFSLSSVLALTLTMSLFLLSSCSKKTYTLMEISSWAKKEDASFRTVLVEGSSGLTCGDYPSGCLSARMVAAQKVHMGLVEFENEMMARKAAITLDQYYYANWLFDDVKDEPVLEAFVKKVFDAKRPLVEENED